VVVRARFRQLVVRGSPTTILGVPVMTSRKAIHSLWFIIQPSEVEGDWEAHCLDFDIITQGETPRQALNIAIESADFTIRRCREEGRDPYEGSAPPEYWALRDQIIAVGTLVKTAEVLGVPRPPSGCYLFNLNIEVKTDFEVIDGGASSPSEPRPEGPTWQKAA
jgi:hypothetical protein